MNKITTTISTHNNVDYLKLAIKSVRKNLYYNDCPFIVHAENCNDGTDKWLEENKEKYDLEIYIDHNDNPKGIGGGMDFCVDKVKTEFVNIIHSDMYVAKNQDIELLKLYDEFDESERLIASSYRIAPDIFLDKPRPGAVFFPKDALGEFWHNFKAKEFEVWAEEFSQVNGKEARVRKAGGAGFFCKKRDYDYIGGNDPLFAPASWEDMDLFIRMQREGYHFIMTPQSLVWHFAARGSHFTEDDFTKKSPRQIKAEQDNMRKWISKWGSLPNYDKATFVMPIDNPNVPNRIIKEEII